MSISSKDYGFNNVDDDPDATLEALNYTPSTLWVQCAADFCGAVAKDSPKNLKAAGWQLGIFSRFCPMHSARPIRRAA